MENRFENFTFLVLRMSKQIQRIKALKIGEYGLKAVHVMCIHYIGLTEVGVTGSELVRLTMEDKAAVSRALSELKEKGYVSYNKQERGGKVTLTESGKLLARYISATAEQAVNAVGKDFTEEERVLLYRMMESITDNLEDYLKKEE